MVVAVLVPPSHQSHIPGVANENICKLEAQVVLIAVVGKTCLVFGSMLCIIIIANNI